MSRIPNLSQRTIATSAELRRPRAVVISLRAEIAQALADGSTLREIWQQLRAEGLFRAGYDRFCKLVRRFETQLRRPVHSAPTTTPTQGFTFKRKNREDLV
jgi:hypothetical protein